MEQATIDLRKEQQASTARPRYRYSAVARFFFRTMDLLAGPGTTLVKAQLVEALAPIPYRAWESYEYARLTQHYSDPDVVQEAGAILRWGRRAQDNEYWHVLLVNEKLRQDGARHPLLLSPPLRALMVASYRVMALATARLDIRRALLLNAEFEDHAEHYYAELVADHPEWEDQPATGRVAEEYGSFGSWADVFRRVGLDEREHMNTSFVFAGRPEFVVHYDGMPALDDAD